MIFTVKDLVTAQEYSDLSIQEVANMLNVSEQHIYRVVSNNLLVNKRYKLIGKNDDYDKTINNKLPKHLLREWDKVTSKFKVYYGGAR